MNDILDTDIVPFNGIDAQLQQNNTVTLEMQPNKRKRKKSEVWQYFTAQPISEDCTRASCNQCNRSFAYINGKKQSGTSHLRRHIRSGVCSSKSLNQKTEQFVPHTPGSQNGAAITARPRKRCRASPASVPLALDQERCINELARVIIGHDYLTSMVEQSSFTDFARSLQPQFSMASFNSVQTEIVSIYRREKLSLANILAEIPSRVSLTLDYWSTDQTIGYAMLTGHFVDADWKLQRRVLNFRLVPFPESDVAFNHAVGACMSEWKLESKLFALTLDQSFANEAVVRNIRGILSVSNPHMLNGQFLMVNCYARVINRLAQEALSSMSGYVIKVRDSVKFVKTSETRERKFYELRQQLRVPCTQNLVIDNREKWDSTYHMLSTACELKEVFDCLDTSDPNYKLAPSMDDWKFITALCAYLKLLFEGANILMSEIYPAAHKFFHEAYRIQFELAHGAFSDDPVVSDLVRPLSEKFDMYWRDCCVVLAMAVVMDPRYKLKLVRFTLTKLYGEDEGDIWVRTIDESMHDLYFEYIAQTLPLPSIHVDQRYDEYIKAESLSDDAASPGDGLSDFDIYISEISDNQTKSELDQYLDEALLPRDDFDIIDWWKLNRIKYPTLSKMAADLLSIPFGTVHRDSVFDTGIRKLDSNRCSLKPGTLEAIVCANDWLQTGTQQSSAMLDLISPTIFKTENELSIDDVLDCADADEV
ncbi:hypothetical protein RND81_14G181300 [Saponaria officinalis]|uniref:BED-type domain-containing protein n=1 Tax=Saponaria officinalis TaxID=3572 RepID=A0AAW1GRL7_SAPOF